jgi:glutamate 5-kinase
MIDNGAEQAVIKMGSSLLAKGIMSIESDFLRGQIVTIVNQNNKELARGIVRYEANDIHKIKGHHSDQIESILGYDHGSVVIHRDDLVLLH